MSCPSPGRGADSTGQLESEHADGLVCAAPDLDRRCAGDRVRGLCPKGLGPGL